MAKALGYYLEHGHIIKEAVIKAYPLFTGAFCLTILTKDYIGRGARHLRHPAAVLWDKLTATRLVFASETCAFHTVGAEFIREIQPGEMVIVTKDGIEVSANRNRAKPKSIFLNLFILPAPTAKF